MIDRRTEEAVTARLERLAGTTPEVEQSPGVDDHDDLEAARRGADATSRWSRIAAAAAIVVLLAGAGVGVVAMRSDSPAPTIVTAADSVDGATQSTTGAEPAPAAGRESCVLPGQERGVGDGPSAEDLAQLQLPDTKIGVENSEGAVVGYVSQSDLGLQSSDTSPEAVERRMESLIPVIDLCDKQVGWLSFQGGHYFTLEEVARPGFDTMSELRRLGLAGQP